jgi:hypothetical protein
VNQISWERCGEIAAGKPARAARLCGSKVPFNLEGASVYITVAEDAGEGGLIIQGPKGSAVESWRRS